jgi:hypothetical protein
MLFVFGSCMRIALPGQDGAEVAHLAFRIPRGGCPRAQQRGNKPKLMWGHEFS